MECTTCRYDSDEGYCGLGKVLVNGDCASYVEGNRAVPTRALPNWLVRLMETPEVLVEDISFPVRGMKEDRSTWDKPNGCVIVRPSKYTILLLEGSPGYSKIISCPAMRDRVHMLDWGPCRLSIDTFYHGGPVVIVMSIHHLDRYPTYPQEDVGEFIWWLNRSASEEVVELFLDGLMALSTLHYRYITTGEYYKSVPSAPPCPTITMRGFMYTFTAHLSDVVDIPPDDTYAYHEGVYRYLVYKYMELTREYRTMPIAEAMERNRYWKDILQIYSQRLC